MKARDIKVGKIARIEDGDLEVIGEVTMKDGSTIMVNGREFQARQVKELFESDRLCAEAAEAEAEAAEAEAAEAEAAEAEAAERRSRSEAIGKTWEDQGVRNARRLRRAVIVRTPEGEELTFKSVRAAFDALELPLSKHIKFRGMLRAAEGETLEFDGYRFKEVL